MLASIDAIRVETALSRFPVHRLAKVGTVRINLREANNGGTTTLQWKVSYNTEYGQPGPLAYKLDTLVVNRRIEEAGRPIPRIVRLGSLKEIAQGLGLGGDTNIVKRALYQNASAFITAKIQYKANDGTERRIEIGDTRYAVVFTGEKLPDGRTADAVHIVLHDFYREILDHALTRPLDYGYLRELPPVSQRLYELLSYRMYAALKHHRPRARLNYSEFCSYAPQIQYAGLGPMRKQMAKVHAPHREAGYIADVEYEPTTDREGRPDWIMIYTPGPKAEAEYRAFTQRGRAELAVGAPDPQPAGLEAELVERGVTRAVAAELVRDYPEDRIREQIERVDWLRAQHPRKISDVGAYLVGAIREDYAPPAGYRSQVAHDRAEQGASESRAAGARARAERERIAAYWAGLTPAERSRVEAEALERAPPEMRRDYEGARLPALRRMCLGLMREAHLRRLLGFSAAG